MKRGVKVGTRIGSAQRTKEDKDLEVGVIQEPLPVYQKELKEDETRLAMGEGERGSDGEEAAMSR